MNIVSEMSSSNTLFNTKHGLTVYKGVGNFKKEKKGFPAL